MSNALQVFHDKPDKPKNFVAYPSDLFSAVNQICNGNEAKVLLTLLGCKGDGSFSPSTAYVQKMAGITQPNNYYKTRKQLETKGLIKTDQAGNIYINTKLIIAKAQKQEEDRKAKLEEDDL
jgi:hypothetical protein